MNLILLIFCTYLILEMFILELSIKNCKILLRYNVSINCSRVFKYFIFPVLCVSKFQIYDVRSLENFQYKLYLIVRCCHRQDYGNVSSGHVCSL